MLSGVYNELYPVVKWNEMREEIYVDVHKKNSTVQDSSHLGTLHIWAKLFTSQIRRYCCLSCHASITSSPVRLNFSDFRNDNSEDCTRSTVITQKLALQAFYQQPSRIIGLTPQHQSFSLFVFHLQHISIQFYKLLAFISPFMSMLYRSCYVAHIC